MVLGEVNHEKLNMLLANYLTLENGYTLLGDLIDNIYSELDLKFIPEYNLENPEVLINIALNFLLTSLQDNESKADDYFWKNNSIMLNCGVAGIAEKYVNEIL